MNKTPAKNRPRARKALPSDLAGAKSRARVLFLVAAFLSLIASVILFFSGSENVGIFVGLWVPSILSLGALLTPSGRE
jgi:uncharacterized membrane protein